MGQKNTGQFKNQELLMKGKNIMNNSQFWNSLDSITRKKTTPETITDFAIMLKKGYEQDLELIISCIDDPLHPGIGYQSYIDTEFGRLMLCYTTMAHANKENRQLPAGDMRNISTATAKCRSIIDNMLTKSVIAGLVFNSDTQKPMIVMKDILQMAMLINE